MGDGGVAVDVLLGLPPLVSGSSGSWGRRET